MIALTWFAEKSCDSVDDDHVVVRTELVGRQDHGQVVPVI